MEVFFLPDVSQWYNTSATNTSDHDIVVETNTGKVYRMSKNSIHVHFGNAKLANAKEITSGSNFIVTDPITGQAYIVMQVSGKSLSKVWKNAMDDVRPKQVNVTLRGSDPTI